MTILPRDNKVASACALDLLPSPLLSITTSVLSQQSPPTQTYGMPCNAQEIYWFEDILTMSTGPTEVYCQDLQTLYTSQC